MNDDAKSNMDGTGQIDLLEVSKALDLANKTITSFRQGVLYRMANLEELSDQFETGHFDAGVLTKRAKELQKELNRFMMASLSITEIDLAEAKTQKAKDINDFYWDSSR